MRKLTLLVAFAMLQLMAFSGGLLTNYNQSAQYIRMLSRNASLDIDAVFYNPAGLVKMQDGWHFAFHSQTVLQTREITSGFPVLNQPAFYKGETTVPVFPNLYAVYKKDKWAFSLGVGPTSGGGTAKFDTGIPTFEIPVAKAAYAFGGLGAIHPDLAVTGYSLDMAFDASSVFWGIQLGATYAINDKFSVYGGVRLLPSTNKYEGAIQNIQLQAAGQMNSAPEWLSGAASQVSGYATQASQGADLMYATAGSMQPIIDQGGGGYTLAQLEGAGFIDATQRAQLEGGLLLAGVPQEQIDMMNAGQVQGAYNAGGDQLTGTAQQLGGTAVVLESASSSMEDAHVDTKQTGFGFTPIIGFNYSPNDDWNFGFKYEHKTKLTLTNDTKVDDVGLFPDGGESNNDVPGIVAAGVGYSGLDWLEAQLSWNMYLDEGVDYGYNVRYLSSGQQVHRDIDHNHWELSLGLQFNLSEKFAFSVGALRSQNGVSEAYQSDFSFSNSANAFSAGIEWKITEKLTFDAGISNIWYEEDTVNFTDPDFGTYSELYDKTTLNIAAGIAYSIF